MTASGPDPTSVSGKPLSVDETTGLLVIGAGHAGCTAAIEASGRGLSVVLVDENPVDAETMDEHVPLAFGGRMTGAARNRTAMTEAVLAASPLIAEAFEAGVDVRLGTACWGLFVPSPTAAWIGGRVAGLVDANGVRHLGFDEAVVATGSRDMGLAFPGWELPGVMGAVAARRLATLYGALDARRAVVLGSGPEALLAALDLVAAGTEVVAVLETAGMPAGPEALCERLAGHGVPILTGHTVVRAVGNATSGVTALVVAALDPLGRRVAGSERTLACDTVVEGIAAVPVIDLLEAAGCRTVFDPARGGHVPVLSEGGATSVPGIRVIGDAAGIWGDKSLDPEISAVEARGAVAGTLGATSGDGTSPAAPPSTDLDDTLKRWVRACVIDADGSPHVCQCEEVTARDVLEVRPPRYLHWQESTQKPADLRTLLGNGPPSPDQVKRLTRAGMGPCQGRRCREQVAVLLALETGSPVSDVPLASYRPPVRPLRLDQMAESREHPAMTEHWQSWFGIETMWLAPWELGPDGRPLEGSHD